MPTAVVVKPGEVAALVPLRDTTWVRIAAFAQVRSLGPYSLKVIEPVGLVPPLRVALSLRTVPTRPPALGVVGRVGLDFWHGSTDKMNVWLYVELSPATTATIAEWDPVAGASGLVR